MTSANESIDDELYKFIGVNDICDEPNIPIYKPKHPKFKKDTLVFSGGAIKGIALIGVLKALQVNGILDHITTFSGASVGTLIILLHILGYSPEEMLDFIKSFDFSRIKQISVKNLLTSYGLDSGVRLEYVIKRLIGKKGYNEDITLKDLFDTTGKKIVLATVCLNTKKTVYMSHESHPDIQVYKAVRMSSSIPVYYTPVFYDKYYYIDGGCIDNYPIHIFKDKIDNVIGVYLYEEKPVTHEINSLETCLFEIINCLMKGADYNSIKGYEEYTIRIDLEDYGFVNYGIGIEEKKKMFSTGFNSTVTFLKNNNLI